MLNVTGRSGLIPTLHLFVYVCSMSRKKKSSFLKSVSSLFSRLFSRKKKNNYVSNTMVEFTQHKNKTIQKKDNLDEVLRIPE